MDVVEFRARTGRTGPNHLQDGIAVVADSWYRAKSALDSVALEWDFGPDGEVSDETQAAEARRLWEETGQVSRETGSDAFAIIAASGRVVSAEYHRSYETHSRMEPISATVSVTDERVDVWSPTQNQASARHCGR